MWVNRKKYEQMKRTAENNEHDARMFRHLVDPLRKDTIVLHGEYVIMSRESYNMLLNKFYSEEDRVKDIQAELEWYKVKYHEMKTSQDK